MILSIIYSCVCVANAASLGAVEVSRHTALPCRFVPLLKMIIVTKTTMLFQLDSLTALSCMPVSVFYVHSAHIYKYNIRFDFIYFVIFHTWFPSCTVANGCTIE